MDGNIVSLNFNNQTVLHSDQSDSNEMTFTDLKSVNLEFSFRGLFVEKNMKLCVK